MRYKKTILGVILVLVIVLTGSQGVFADTLLYSGGGTSATVWEWSGTPYSTFVPVQNGILKSIHVIQQQNDQGYIQYYCKVSTSTPPDISPSNGAVALSDPLNAQNTSNYIDTYYNFSGSNEIALTAGTTYYFTFGKYTYTPPYYAYTFQNFETSATDNFSMIYREVYGASPTITWNTPTAGSHYTTSNNFDFSVSFTILSPASVLPRITFDRSELNDTSTIVYSGFWDIMYGASHPAGAYTETTTINNIPNGEYKNFHVYLLDINNNNILASTTAPLYTEIFIEAPNSQSPFSYGQYNYYTGSSTVYYNSILPAIFTNNGITTSTSVYDNITGLVDKLLSPIYGVAQNWQSYFNSTSTIAIGGQVKTGILTIWGWVKSIDNFLGGYPYSETILLFLFAEFAIIVIKILRVLLFR